MKNRHFLLVAFLLVFSVSVIAQNKIGDNPTVIQAGSLLELESLTKSLRLPRIPLNDVTKWTLDGTPVSGMLVFNETGTVPKGLYYWSTTSSQWVQVVNASDLTLILANKVDKVVGKDLSTNDYTTAEKTKLAAITGTNTGDQDLSVKVDKVVGKDLSTNDYTTAEKTKLAAITGSNTGDQDLSSFATTASVTTGLALKEEVANKSTDVATDAASNSKYPGVKAIKDYVDLAVAGATIADANATTKGKIQLAGDLSGTADAPTVPALANKVNTTVTVNGQALSGNITLTKSDIALGNVDNTADLSKPISTSAQTALDLKAPLVSPALTGTPTAPTAAVNTNNTEIATTAFVTTAVAAATIADADATTKGKIQLAGDLTGTAAAPLIANSAVTLSKMANLAATTLVGNSTAGSAAPQAITIGSGLALSGGVLNTATTSSAVTSVTTQDYTVLDTDKIIFYTGGVLNGEQNFVLPDPTTCPGRRILIINDSSGGLISFFKDMSRTGSAKWSSPNQTLIKCDAGYCIEIMAVLNYWYVVVGG
jgi:hypothetical protein